MTTPTCQLDLLSDDELRYLRKTLSMSQAQLESRLNHVQGEDRERTIRDIRLGSTTYAKVQLAINHRLLGDEEVA